MITKFNNVNITYISLILSWLQDGNNYKQFVILITRFITVISTICNITHYNRPLYLPIRSVVTLGNFSVSSNLIPETNTSYLRFLAQECSLHLSYLHSKTVAPDDRAPDLHKEYVCVIDVGLFELSLRMEDKSNGVSGNIKTVYHLNCIHICSS